MNASAAEAKLRQLRLQIDRYDRALLAALAGRFEAVRAIGLLKKKSGLPIESPGRWAEILKTRSTQAARAGIPSSLVRGLLSLIHAESLRSQIRIGAPNRRKSPMKGKKRIRK